MGREFRFNALAVSICCALLALPLKVTAVEFNTDILDTDDKHNIDLSRFSEAGYIMPGVYSLSLNVNDRAVKDIDVMFFERSYPHDDKANASNSVGVEACLNKEQVLMLGLKSDAAEKITWWHNNECADFSALSGTTLRGDLSQSSLKISIPQAWLEYQDASWLPPSRWEDGIPGMLLDYNLNTNVTRPQTGNQTENASGTGTLGANAGAWRLRGDWQANYSHTAGSRIASRTNFDWSRIYAYRALRELTAKLSVGEDYLSSDLFDSWRFTGASLVSDDRMLPPRLRGYAPEIRGIARTNAKVIISQQGRVLYETTVASGPFRIQELNEAVSGHLDVRVEEQDGKVQTFQVDTATIPYLTRPGQLRYKLAGGRPNHYNHHIQGPAFGTGEFSWGVSNAWSLYGGAIVAGDYNSYAVGIGRDLLALGALSADVTQSFANLPSEPDRKGKSWRLSYSKRFDEYNSEVTFAGYRFSERDYMSMGEYLDTRYGTGTLAHDKELYTITANKSFSDLRLSAYLSWSHQTYWDREATDRYSFSLSHYFDLGAWRNISATASASRSEYNSLRDDAAYFSLSIPFGNGSASYNGNWNNNHYSQTAGWYQRLSNGDSYRIQAGTRSGNGESITTQANGYYSHYGDISDISANASWSENDYTSAGLSLSGGITATAKGAAFQPGSSRGATRMLISTDGIAGVPVGPHEKTNAYGIAVVPDVASYYRSSTSIDVNKLPDDVEAAGSPVVEAALTEGAIGYRRFDVLKGKKLLAYLRLADGSYPPFGATVENAKSRELGIVSDGGVAWLSGISPEEKLSIRWNGEVQCQVSLPKFLPQDQILLLCTALN